MIRALLGGSFDPVHVGHTAMARHVLSVGLVDIVHVVPAWLSPHKRCTVAATEDRLAMVRLAFSSLADVVIESCEIDTGHSCYTVDTLASLVAQFSEDSWTLMIGGDNLATLSQWQQPDRLQTLATILVLGREGCDLSAEAISAAGLQPDRVLAIRDFDQAVSSTAVRGMLASGPYTCEHLVENGIPAPVAHYIIANHLYFPDRNGENRVPDPD